jgi:hypothetical protein
LCAAIEPLQDRLLDHPMYALLEDPEDLKVFMAHHVFAVWDFMSLLTRLQREFTSVELPWRPAMANPALSRFVNTLKLAEESDVDTKGTVLSHFALYLLAMQEVGANTTAVLSFVRGLPADVPSAALAFVDATLEVATHGSPVEVAACFSLGREQLIPGMFRPILERTQASRFSYYLARHIELDEGEHSGLAALLVTDIAGTNDRLWRLASTAAQRALEARISLWDGVRDCLVARRAPAVGLGAR